MGERKTVSSEEKGKTGERTEAKRKTGTQERQRVAHTQQPGNSGTVCKLYHFRQYY